MSDRNTFGKVFKISGFTPEEIHDIECRTKGIKQTLKEQKARRRAEKYWLNFRDPKISQLTKENSVKQQKNDAQKPRKLRGQKIAEQIQYGYDIVTWWGLQHE